MVSFIGAFAVGGIKGFLLSLVAMASLFIGFIGGPYAPLTVFTNLKAETETSEQRIETVYYYSPTCPACVDLQEHEEFNIFVEDNQVQKVDVSKITAEEKNKIIQEYGLKKIPALYFVEDGEIKNMISGKQEILDHIRIDFATYVW